MEVHLVDATYELFRAHFSPRPPVLGRDGQVLSGVSGLVEQLCYLLREQGGTHVGCATDRVIESFRNDLYPGYKTSAGMPPELLAQFPIAEQAIEALGVTLWPMVEFEADDAIAAAAERFAADPARRADPHLHAGQGHGPARGGRADRPLGPPPRDDLRRRRRPREVGRRTRERPGPARARRRRGRRLSRAPRLGRQGRVGRARAVRPPRGHPRQRLGVGRQGAARRGDAGGDPPRPLGGGPPLPRPRPPADARRRRPDPAAATSRSCAGAAPTARPGRRSATSGTCRGCASARTPGATGRQSGAPSPSPAPRSAAACRPWWAGGAATSPNARVALSTSNHGPPAVSVTVAPARSAMSPAAATSQADMPPDWTNASKRPFATYARRERRGAHRPRHADRLAHGSCARRDRPATEREMHDPVAERLLLRGMDRGHPPRPRPATHPRRRPR